MQVVDIMVLGLAESIASGWRAAARSRCIVTGCSVGAIGLLQLVKELNVRFVQSVLVQEFVHVQVLELVAELLALEQVILVPQIGAQESVTVDF